MSHDVLRKIVDLIQARTGHAPKKSGNGWSCRCPAHPDKSPSLSVRAGDKAVLLKCFRGCETEAIVQALGLTMSDLYYEPKKASRKGESARKGPPKRAKSTPRERSKPPEPPPPVDAPAEPDEEPTGCTVAELAQAKGFTEAYLRELGCVDETDRRGRARVRIPYFLADGTPAPRARFRESLERGRRFSWGGTAEAGEPTLYGLERLPATRVDGLLILVEGETDCWTLWLHGYAALGFPGASTPGKLQAADLDGIDRVAIVHEGDAGGDTFVEGLSRRLEALGFEGVTRVIEFGRDKDPNGLWCRLQEATPAPHPSPAEAFKRALRQRLHNARAPSEVLDLPHALQPGDIADLFIRESRDCRSYHAMKADPWAHRRLLFHRGRFYGWTGQCYEVIPEAELQAMVAQFIRSRSWENKRQKVERGNPTRALVNNTILNLSHHCLVPSSASTPVWRDGRSGERSLVLSNGVLNVDQCLEAMDAAEAGDDWRGLLDDAIQRHAPDLFTTIALPYEWNPAATCPTWQTFLERVLPDAGLRDLAQQFCGYCLLPTQWAQKIMILQGEGSNGKSVFMAMLARLVGETNCSATPLEFLHLPHMQEPLENKLVNLATEWGRIEPGGLNLLKAISGGDPILVNPKGKAAYEAMIYARFVVATNDPPRLSDRTEAIWRRLLTMPFTVRIPADERKPMEAYVSELSEELPGILVWALRGLWKLIRAGGFVDCSATRALRSEYEEDANPVITWADSELEVAEHGEEHSETLYESYAKYCKANGFMAMSSTRWGRELNRWYKRATGGEDSISKRRVTLPSGRRMWTYEGVALSSLSSVGAGGMA